MRGGREAWFQRHGYVPHLQRKGGREPWPRAWSCCSLLKAARASARPSRNPDTPSSQPLAARLSRRGQRPSTFYLAGSLPTAAYSRQQPPPPPPTTRTLTHTICQEALTSRSVVTQPLRFMFLAHWGAVPPRPFAAHAGSLGDLPAAVAALGGGVLINARHNHIAARMGAGGVQGARRWVVRRCMRICLLTQVVAGARLKDERKPVCAVCA